MPAVARGAQVDSVATNHGCTPTTATLGLSNTVTVNSIGVHRKGDENVSHTFNPPNCPTHTTIISSCSSTVYANGRGVARIGDAYTGGETVSSGSGNVFAGG